MNQAAIFFFLLLPLLLANFVKVAIVGTNDIHGSALPTQLHRPDLNQNYTYGGLEYLASMVDTLRHQHSGNFLYLDAGDQFQGGIESGPLVSSGAIINDYLNTAGVDSSAFGNHQFDFGPGFLSNYFTGRRDGSWNLAANLRSESGQQEFLPKHKNSHLYELASGIKIGVIGLTTVETPFTTGAFKEGLFPPYQFSDYAQIVIESSRELREHGANAVLIVSHAGNDCNADHTFGVWEEQTRQSSTCSATDEISKLLAGVPVGTVDGIVQGHRHKFSHHFIRGVPVVGTINGGYYFNVLYLYFYNGMVYDKVIEGPVPVCQKVFANLNRCNYLSPEELELAGELVEWEFHGAKVTKHPEVKRLFQTKWLPKMTQFLEPLALNQVTLERTFEGESRLGNLVTDLLSAACPAHDFVLLNEGGFRSVWYPGVLQFQHFYNMFPFLNTVLSFEITGAELLKTLEILQAGKKSFYPTKNLKQRVTVYGNGTRQLTSATFADGTPFEANRTYRGVSMNFLLQGGDDFKEVMGKVYTLRGERSLGEFKNLVKPEMMKYGTISEAKVFDPLNPRLVIDRV